jgi:hypothetical protein
MESEIEDLRNADTGEAVAVEEEAASRPQI